jgi:integrase/recombinase XerC
MRPSPEASLPLSRAASVSSGEGEIVEAFLSGRGERTTRAYRQDLEDFARFAAAKDAPTACAWLLSRGHGPANRLGLAYRAALREKGLSPATINRRLAALRSLTKLARLVGAIDWALEVPNLPSEAYRDTRGPGVAAIRAMLDGAPPREAALLHLLYDLGLRRAEVVALDVADLELSRQTVFVQGKGRLEKAPLALPPAACEALAAWLDVRGDAPGPLFINFDRAGKGEERRLSATSLYRIVRERAERVGVRATPHGLRHTAITEACKAAAEAGIGLEEVMDFSRHRNVGTLLRYRDRERNVQGRLATLVSEAKATP